MATWWLVNILPSLHDAAPDELPARDCCSEPTCKLIVAVLLVITVQYEHVRCQQGATWNFGLEQVLVPLPQCSCSQNYLSTCKQKHVSAAGSAC